MMQFGNLQSLLLEGRSVKRSTVYSLISTQGLTLGLKYKTRGISCLTQNYFCVFMELLIKSCQSLCSALQGTGRHAAGHYCISELICIAPCFLRAAALTAQLIGINSPLKCTFHNGLPTVLSILQCFFSIYYLYSLTGAELKSDGLFTSLTMDCPSLSQIAALLVCGETCSWGSASTQCAVLQLGR